jgi:hypothetical protein
MAQLFSTPTGVPVLRSSAKGAASRPGHKLLVIAGLDPAIHPLRKSLSKMMDTRAFAAPKGLRPRRRVKPAYDAEYVAASCENFGIQISNSQAPAFSRRRASWAFSLPPLLEGRRNAERRTLVTAAAYFPDCRETEAHGNASQRPAAATSSSLGPVLPSAGASKLAIQAGFPTLHPSRPAIEGSAP